MPLKGLNLCAAFSLPLYLIIPQDPMQLRQEMSDEQNLRRASRGSPPPTKEQQQPRCCSHGIVISFIVLLVALPQIRAKALYKDQLHCGWSHDTTGGNSYTIACSAPTPTFFPFFLFYFLCVLCVVYVHACVQVPMCVSEKTREGHRVSSFVALCFLPLRKVSR